MTLALSPIAAATHPDPYPFYAALVRERPIHQDAASGCWVVASAATVSAALSNDACRVRPPAEPVPPALVGSPVGEVFRRLVRMNDGPVHRAKKEAIAQTLAAFTPEAIATTTRRLAPRHLRPTAPPRGDELDQLMFRLPAEIVASLFGVPDERLAATAAAASDFVQALAPGGEPAQAARGNIAVEALAATFRACLSGHDHDDGTVANVIGLLLQTHDATAGLIGNGLVALATHPDLRSRLAADRLLFADFVAEVVRHDPPVQNTRRFVAAPTVIAGVALAPGDAILVLLAAANRDPELNHDADRFELTRRARRSFTFGAGPHACPGERLATVIAATVIEILDVAIEDPTPLVAGRAYRPSPNARIPRFG